MAKAKKYLIDLGVGFGFGLIFFFGPMFFISNFGFLGFKLLEAILPTTLRGSSLYHGILYIVLSSIIPFIIYFLLPIYKKYHQRNPVVLFFSFLFFSLGVYIVMFLLLLGVAKALSNWSP